MPYRLNADGVIECDTPDEARGLLQTMQTRPALPPAPRGAAAITARPTRPVRGAARGGGGVVSPPGAAQVVLGAWVSRMRRSWPTSQRRIELRWGQA
jgi:hypothetical protein